jgi:hypothetical protein
MTTITYETGDIFSFGEEGDLINSGFGIYINDKIAILITNIGWRKGPQVDVASLPEKIFPVQDVQDLRFEIQMIIKGALAMLSALNQ